MYRIRMRFTKTDYMIFISHLDLVRMMERALRRANVPLAFSQGFNPHPKISFATALALGVSSDGEYMDIEIEEKIDLDAFINNINTQLPNGIKIIQCKYIDMKCEALMAIVDYSTYMVKCQLDKNVSKEILDIAIDDFLKNEEILVYKTIKKKKNESKKEINIRPYINYMEMIDIENTQCFFKMTLATGSKGNLKPEVVIEKFKEITKTPILLDKIRIHRLDLYGVKDEKFITPLEIAI